MMKDSSPDMASNSEQNAYIIMLSEPQEEIPYQNSDSAMDGRTSLGAIHVPLSNFDLELPLESLGAGSSWPSEVSQSASTQWQYDNILLGHCFS